ncbi:hypothetical protein [Glycomyces paridis]|uniref:Uncharacterized protein n=1 Tax=Glycomyces paridis TaxID=2126555 RepID=A0A4S8P6M3_9ACTN|nr:hypothetical protein [Glycomyces paridis]THV25927.1 hypothetical protein E9998_19525 [Glycomyces paridis]
MTDFRLLKIFAWTIGVLVVLWMLTECLGGVDPADPGDLGPERDDERYAADCGRAREALEVAAGADAATIDAALDRIDALGAEIADGELKALVAGYGEQAQAIVAAEPESLDEAMSDFRDPAAFDLALRCPAT